MAIPHIGALKFWSLGTPCWYSSMLAAVAGEVIGGTGKRPPHAPTAAATVVCLSVIRGMAAAASSPAIASRVGELTTTAQASASPHPHS
eukprot:CAMPEP_0178376240 /NCGR_PEP_ID=MMETSP0689_2-20121128/3300_1 /TAXON_ID=160604 /ORGANISM="Amphidinium massartii, Strain CS-259" /LENGTH=88 /DNA_ID=CAMNT_0019996255 /DNA_START=335 /DNA_END=598 /DNA_ORIENTATION=-